MAPISSARWARRRLRWPSSGFGGEVEQAIGDLVGRLTARQRDVGGFDGFVFLVAQDAGHFGEAALRAGERTAESAHPLDDGQIAFGAEPARRIAVPQRLVFRLQGGNFSLQAAFALIEARRSASSRSNVVLLIHI
jgi:hypothetical protein